MTNWKLTDRGFLPLLDPLKELDRQEERFDRIEELGAGLPESMGDPAALRETFDALAVFDYSDLDDCIGLDRAMMLFSYFASAYVWVDPDNPAKVIPSGISVPLVRLAAKLGRPPILSYASYCLGNWRRIDQKSPIELGNIELLQSFRGLEDESGFILVHTDIESQANAALWGILQAKAAISDDSCAVVANALDMIGVSIRCMNDTFGEMPNQCDPDVYYRSVRPYIFSFTDVVYKDCFSDRPQSYRGETGAQSSVVPSLVAALGIEHKGSILTKHLNDMRRYMPADHRKFIEWVAGTPSIRQFVMKNKGDLAGAYDYCLLELLAFRGKHLEFADTYINQKVADPTGTGGTPYMQWLSQLRDETEQHLLES